jgi:hypothetical protein
MNDKVRKHLEKYCKSKNWPATEENMLEVLRYQGTEVSKEEFASYRWWNESVHVVELDGMYICYVMAHANRDESVYELGWEFDWDSVQEVRPVEVTVTKYVLAEREREECCGEGVE